MGCIPSSHDVMKRLFERNARKTQEMLHNDVNQVNTVMQYEELQFKWASRVISQLISQSFHQQVASLSVSLVSFLNHELGYELKSTILFASDLLIQKLLEEVKRVPSVPMNEEMLNSMVTMLSACKKYWTILSKQLSSNKFPAILPFLLLCSLGEIYHIFTSLCNMYAGSEKLVWWYQQQIDGDLKSQYPTYTKYLESIQGAISTAAGASGSSQLIETKAKSRKSIKATMKLKCTIFDITFPYLSTFEESVFDLFCAEMEEELIDFIKLYRLKQKYQTVATMVHDSPTHRNSNTHKRSFDDAEENRQMIFSKQIIRQINDIRTGTIVTASVSRSASQLEDIQFDIEDDEESAIPPNRVSDRKRTKNLEDYLDCKVVDGSESGIRDLMTNVIIEDLVPSIYSPTPTTFAHSFTACKTFQYFSSVHN